MMIFFSFRVDFIFVNGFPMWLTNSKKPLIQNRSNRQKVVKIRFLIFFLLDLKKISYLKIQINFRGILFRIWKFEILLFL